MSVSVDDVLNSDWPMGLNPEFDGACPCNTIEGDGFKIKTHCWRTRIDGCSCRWSGVHVSGLDIETAKKVAEHVRDNNWWQPPRYDWDIVITDHGAF